MNKDKAGASYWDNVWQSKNIINEVDIDYYTNRLLHKLYVKYLKKDSNKSIVEIGCALSSNLLYFNKYFNFQINGFDYELNSVQKTQEIYNSMNYKANIYHRDFFSHKESEKYDIVISYGVFEHFDDLDWSISHTRHYLNSDGTIITVIPNMNGIVGFLQRILNRSVYDVHIPYTKNDIETAHKKAGYKKEFCGYYGLYQAGVINLKGHKYENVLRKILAIPGKPIYYLNKFLKIPFDSKYISPYIIYIGKL